MRVWTAFALICALTFELQAFSQPLEDHEYLAEYEDEQQVELSFRSLYQIDHEGSQALRELCYNPVLIRARNRTNRQLNGKVVIEITTYSAPPTRHEVSLDLPPGETREAQLTLFVPDRVARFEGHYETPSFRTHPFSQMSSPSRFDLITMLVSPGSLQRAQVQELAETLPPGSEVSLIGFDTPSGDPLLPRHVAGWAPIGLFVTNVALLDRADEEEREAMMDWVRTGGQVLIFIENEDDLRRPWLRTLVGAIELVGNIDDPSSVPHLQGEDLQNEFFGSSTEVELGRVFLSTGTLNYSTQSTETIGSIIAHQRNEWTTDFGRSYIQDYRGLESDLEGFAVLLDPNQSYRMAFLAVALVLLFYVVLVGPVNFIVVRRLRRPTLALVTTPVLAVLALASIGVVGVVQKGVRLRARSLEFVRLAEGGELGTARTYTGLFHGRSVDFDLEGPDFGMMRIVRTEGGEAIGAVEHGGGNPVYRSIRGSFWSTLFTIEETFVDAGGPVTFEREGSHIIAVRNDTEHTFASSVLFNEDLTTIHQVGPLEPGQRGIISGESSILRLGPGSVMGSRPHHITDDEQTFARHLGLAGEQEQQIVQGLLRTGLARTHDLTPLSNRPISGNHWFFLAKLTPRQRDPVAGIFEPDLSLRFLWVKGRSRLQVARWDASIYHPSLDPPITAPLEHEAPTPSSHHDAGLGDRDAEVP